MEDDKEEDKEEEERVVDDLDEKVEIKKVQKKSSFIYMR